MTDPITDPALLAQLNGGVVAPPKAVADPALLAQLNSSGSKTWTDSAVDFAKSVPHGLMQGISGVLSASGKAAAGEQGFADQIPDQKQTAQILEENVTGKTHEPIGRAGRFGSAIGEGLANPVTYIGPGGLGLKIAGSALSSVGSEGAGQAAEGTGYEAPARILGALTGGVAAAKALGPTSAKAVTPTLPELKQSADAGYAAARNSGLELHPNALTGFAAKAEQDLTNGPKYAFTGGQNGTAPKTMAIVEDLQQVPAGARVTAPNLDTIRIRINNVAGETGLNGKPTADAKAAMVLKSHYNNFLENMDNLPAGHVVAGRPEDYVRATKQANGDYAAFSRGQTIDTKLTRAENNAAGGIATSPDNQIKSQIRTILNNPKAQRGFSAEEIAAMQRLNDGTITSNTLRQLGRGGSGVIPMAMQASAAIPAAAATGGASVIPQVALALGLYGAKKMAEGMTMSKAQNLANMLAQRSPLYESHVKSLPVIDTTPNKAAIARSLMSAIR